MTWGKVTERRAMERKGCAQQTGRALRLSFEIQQPHRFELQREPVRRGPLRLRCRFGVRSNGESGELLGKMCRHFAGRSCEQCRPKKCGIAGMMACRLIHWL